MRDRDRDRNRHKDREKQRDGVKSARVRDRDRDRDKDRDRNDEHESQKKHIEEHGMKTSHHHDVDMPPPPPVNGKVDVDPCARGEFGVVSDDETMHKLKHSLEKGSLDKNAVTKSDKEDPEVEEGDDDDLYADIDMDISGTKDQQQQSDDVDDSGAKGPTIEGGVGTCTEEEEDDDRESRSSRRKKRKKPKRKRSKERDRERDRDRDRDKNRERERHRGIDRDRERDRNRDRDRGKDAHRRRRDDGGSRRRGERNRDRGKGRKGRGSSGGGDRSTSSRDDSYGHFEGGPGTVIYHRYRILKDVGLGTFGRVVQAIDLQRGGGTSGREGGDQKLSSQSHSQSRSQSRSHSQSHSQSQRDRERDRRKSKTKMEDTVAIKIVRNVKRYHESALIEADILKDVNRRGGRGESLCAVLLRQFDLPQGHCCLVFECLGRSLYDFMKTHGFKPFPLFCVREFARQILDALDFIHGFGLIHTDLKPENILLKHNKERSYRNEDGTDQQIPASTSIKLIDFGGATYDNDKKSSVINTRQYRAPEVILGLGWSLPSDLWSTGCIIAELYQGDLLFQTHDNKEHLALMERIIGRFPLDMLSRSKTFGSTVFDSYGWHCMELPSASKSHVNKALPLESMVRESDQGEGLGTLLRSLLTIDPAVRATAGDALKSAIFSFRESHESKKME